MSVAKILSESQHPFTDIVETIIIKKQNNEAITIQEQQIDIMVYNLYGLSHKEVKTIDPNFPLTQEEYDNYQIS